MSDLDSLREEVNPVFTTAQACVRVNAGLGDEDSLALLKELGFESPRPSPESGGDTKEMNDFAAFKSMPGFSCLIETRFTTSNNLIMSGIADTIVDIPCGYTARGVKLSKTDIDYYGLDLPVVIDSIKPAVERVSCTNDNIHYHAVDATNYNSISDALSGARGKLLVTTEGLLMYFTQSELEEVFRNVRTLLIEHGGCWVTTDNEIVKAQNEAMRVIAGDNPGTLKQMHEIMRSKTAGSSIGENSFFKPDEVESFIDNMGFDLKKIPLYDYLPETLNSICELNEEKQKKVRDVFKKVFFWVMTARETGKQVYTSKGSGFGITLQRSAGTLHFELKGRLDTITSPELLDTYRKAAEEVKPEIIIMDMKDLEYISSAGLRVFMIMKRDIPDDGAIRIINLNDSVREIFETTGFDLIFKLDS